MKVGKQQHQQQNYSLKVIEPLGMQVAHFICIYSLAQVVQLYLVGSFNICQNVA